MTMKFLGLIPARGGSVRVKNKNILKLGGKHLIDYTIEAAKASLYLDRIVVSTDSSEIADVARRAGAEVPFMRPAEIAGKDATEWAFHHHAIQWLGENEGYTPDFIVNLYPTSPFRTTVSIDSAIKLLLDNPEADGLRSVVKCSEHPYKMWKKQDGKLRYFVDDPDPNVHTLSYHLLPEVFIQNASIYIIKTDVVLNQKTTIGKNMLGFEMSERESLDINTPLDIEFAEFLLSRKA